jgi:hypothetical protein
MSSRKQASGCEKRKRKKPQDDLIESQRGSIDKVFKSSRTAPRNPDELAIVVVEEQTNTIPEFQGCMKTMLAPTRMKTM